MQKFKEAILYLILLLVLLIFLITKIRPQVVQVLSIQKDLKTKNIEYLDDQRKLDELKSAAAEKNDVSGLTKTIYKPGDTGNDVESSFTVMFEDIIDMAKYNGIKIYAVEYVYNPTDDEFIKGAADKYNVCQIKMEVIADYDDLASFIKEIYKYPYLINIEQIELTPYQRNKKVLITNLTLKLYSEK